MKHMMKKLAAIALLLVTMVMATGCDAIPKITLDPQDLYSLPMLPDEYTELNLRINEVLSTGAEYAAPASGTNIQPVQLSDLDGDGLQEAVAFFRNSADEKPLKIYIFKNNGDTYDQQAVIEGSGTSIYSIAYRDLNADGRTELLVGWRVSTDLQMLSVYTLHNGEAEELIRTNYVKYTVCDLEEMARQELLVLRADEEGTGVADYYGWRQGSLALETSVHVSMTMAELSQQGRITTGYLQDLVPAVFITGTTAQTQTITDILTMRNGDLANITLSDITGVSTEVASYSGLYPTDINNDSLTEVPSAVYQQNEEGGAWMLQRVDWSSYSADGEGTKVMSTYHDLESGWYLRLPEKWNGRIFASRVTGTDEATVTFYIQGSAATQPKPFLRISVFTGSNRVLRAQRGEKFILSNQGEVIYAAELLEANGTWNYGTTKEEVAEAFSLIVAEWVTSDN